MAVCAAGVVEYPTQLGLTGRGHRAIWRRYGVDLLEVCAAAVPGSADRSASACCMPWWSFARRCSSCCRACWMLTAEWWQCPLKVAAELGCFPSSARALQIAGPVPRHRPAPVTTATCPRRPAAIYLAQDPGVFHDTPAGDVDQAAAGRGDAGHGAGHDLDGLRVRYED